MLRQVSLFGKLLSNMKGKEAVIFRGILSAHLNLRFPVYNMMLPSCVTCRMFSITKKLKEDKAAAFKRTQVFEANNLAPLNSVEEVLDTVTAEKFHITSVNLVLRRLTELQQEDGSESLKITTDARFVKMMYMLSNRAPELSPYIIIDSLSYLLQLSKEDLDVIKVLETRLKSMLFRLSIAQLIRLVQMHRKSNETSLRQEICNEAIAVLEKRWVEIITPKDLVSMFYLVSADKTKLLINLEEKVLEMSESMSCKDLYQILYLMAKRNSRNTPVIRSIVYHMNKFTLGLSSLQLANLSYCCAKMSIYDSTLMNSIVQSVLSGAVETAELSSVLHSLGLLRWFDPQLMDVVAGRFLAEKVLVVPHSWVTLLLTAAHVNYLPSAIATNVSEVVGKVEAIRETDPKAWLDVVWSLGALSLATPPVVSSVLSEDFINSIRKTSESNMVGVCKKLLNINSVAKHELSNYTGPFLSDKHLDEFVKQIPVPANSPLMNCLLDTLGNMANLDKYVLTSVRIPAGFVIDAELLVNSSGELQPLKHGKKPSSSSDLQKGFHRVAIKLLEFEDMTQGASVTPTGPNMFAARFLPQYGYKLIQIPYKDLDMRMTAVLRVQYLNARIKEALSAVGPGGQTPVQKPLGDSGTDSSATPQHQTENKGEMQQHTKSTSAILDPSPKLKPAATKSTSAGNTQKKPKKESQIKISMKDILDDSSPENDAMSYDQSVAQIKSDSKKTKEKNSTQKPVPKSKKSQDMSTESSLDSQLKQSSISNIKTDP